MSFMNILLKSKSEDLLFHLGRARRNEEYEWGKKKVDEFLEEIEKRKASGNWDIAPEEQELHEYSGYIKGASIEELEEMKEGLKVSRRMGVHSPRVQQTKEEAVDQLLTWKKKREERQRRREERAMKKKGVKP